MPTMFFHYCTIFETFLFHLCKLDDKKNLLKTEQSLQGEEVLKEKGKAIESFEDDILNGEERVNLEK